MIKDIKNTMVSGVVVLNPLKHIRIFNKEDCPCGSGNNYIGCCKDKPGEPIDIDTKKPPEIQLMDMMRKSIKMLCMHPDQQNCKGKIKRAHALQNNKIISLLAGPGRHVYILDTKRKPLLIEFENGDKEAIVELSRTSTNNATTEMCFCDLHDNIVFSAIESRAPDFDELSEEMKFTYAYKAFIFEYYKQFVAFSAFKECFRKNPQAFNSFYAVRIYRILQLKTSEYDPIKEHFDKEILAQKHDGVETCVVKIPEQVKFAAYAYIAPDYNLDGKKIRHTVKGFMHRLAITVFPEENQSYILLSCLESEKLIYGKLFKQLKDSSIEKVKYYISMVLPLYSENMVLSPVLWDSWAEETKMLYTVYANTNGPNAAAHSRDIGMLLRNAAKIKPNYDYNKRSRIDLFV